MEKLMNFQTSASVALTLAAALALSACDTTPRQAVNQQAAAQSAANAAQAQRDAEARAEQAQAQRKLEIAEANRKASPAKFVPQSYATWTDGHSPLVLHFLRNGKVSWVESAGDDSKPFTRTGTWRLQKGQLVVKINHLQDKKPSTFVFQPKAALIAPAETREDCKPLAGLLPVSANAQTENLDKIYLWPKTQLETNQGSCIQ